MFIINEIFRFLESIDDFFWAYIGFTIIILSGIYISHRCKWFQFQVLLSPCKTLKDLKKDAEENEKGTNPFKLYFASVGGMIGLGNMVAVITAMIIGGPGALFWLWVAACFGMIIKYSEIYLGVRFRVPNKEGGYDGGPMYYLRHAFSSGFLKKYIPILISVFLCIYGIEIYQFVVIVDTLSDVSQVDRLWVVLPLLGMTLYAGFGGVKRLANICSVLMPFFMISYVILCFWVIGLHIGHLPSVLKEVFRSAFLGSAPLGGFVGSSMLLAAQQGAARAVYSGDIGIGYDSIIQSETRSQHPERQARLAIFGVAGDLLFCTMSMLVVLLTGLLWSGEGLKASEYVARALALVIPWRIDIFMAIFIFLAGWTTITGYVVVGMKAARFLSPRYGFIGYFIYATLVFALFSYVEQSKVLLIMSICGGILMLINVIGIIRLRKELVFK